MDRVVRRAHQPQGQFGGNQQFADPAVTQQQRRWVPGVEDRCGADVDIDIDIEEEPGDEVGAGELLDQVPVRRAGLLDDGTVRAAGVAHGRHREAGQQRRTDPVADRVATDTVSRCALIA